MAADLAGNEDFLEIALVEVPPYGNGLVTENSPCTLGRLAETNEWFVTTPAVTLICENAIQAAWQQKAPDFDAVLEIMAAEKELLSEKQFRKPGKLP